MKKNWVTPEISSLEITETAGGTTWNDIADGPAWQDKDGYWHEPVGQDDSGS